MSRFPHPDDEGRLATPAEAVAEWARNIGGEFKDRAWLLHDWDVWVANPHYAGPPVPHPEDEPWDTDGDTSKWNENGEASEAANDRYASASFPGDDYDAEAASEAEFFEGEKKAPDDDIPF